MPSPTPTVLVAASSTALRHRVADAFLHDGFDVDDAGSFASALERTRRSALDAVVVAELGAPAAAYRLIEAIRGEQPSLAVVAIARGPGELDRIRPLHAGADTVAPAECSHTELRANLDAVLRRRTGGLATVIRIGGLEVRPVSRQVTYRGENVELTAKEYALLLALAAEPERVFTKPELLREVWGFASEGCTRTLDSHACRLRRKLSRPGTPGFVQNIWGVGYRLLEPSALELIA